MSGVEVVLPLKAQEAAQGGFSLDSSLVTHILRLGAVPLVLLVSGQTLLLYSSLESWDCLPCSQLSILEDIS